MDLLKIILTNAKRIKNIEKHLCCLDPNGNSCPPISVAPGNTITCNPDGIFSAGGGVEIGGNITGGTTGSVLFVGTGSTIAQDNSNLFYDNTNNRLGIGTNTPYLPLDVRGSSIVFLGQTNYQSLLAANFTATSYVVQGSGNWGLSIQRGSASTGAALLTFYKTRSNDAGTKAAAQVGDSIGSISYQAITGDNITVTQVAVLQVAVESVLPIALGGRFMFQVCNPVTGVLTEQMRLDGYGRLSIGHSAPTAFIHIKAGAADAGMAALKFNSGVVLTTPETGAMEYNGTNLFFTRTGTTRETVLTGAAGIPPLAAGSGTAPNAFWGGNTQWMGNPSVWADVVLNGTSYKLPLYDPS